jgi:hypothetical protein
MRKGLINRKPGNKDQEFAKFREELRNAIKPNNDFEDLLALEDAGSSLAAVPAVEGRGRHSRSAVPVYDGAVILQNEFLYLIENKKSRQ